MSRKKTLTHFDERGNAHMVDVGAKDITERILRPNLFGNPAIVTTQDGTPVIWRNLPLDSTLIGASAEDSVRILKKLDAFMREMDAVHAPVPIEISRRSAPICSPSCTLRPAESPCQNGIFPGSPGAGETSTRS